jgi:hypothetical protein
VARAPNTSARIENILIENILIENLLKIRDDIIAAPLSLRNWLRIHLNGIRPYGVLKERSLKSAGGRCQEDAASAAKRRPGIYRAL